MSAPEKRPQKARDAWEQAVRACPDVTGLRLLVVLTLATFGNRDGTGIRVGLGTLARATGLGESTVRRHVVEATRSGWLVRDSRGGRHGSASTASAYRLAVPQPFRSERLDTVPTAQPRAVEPVPTARSESPNRSLDASQPLASERLPGSDQGTTPAVAVVDVDPDDELTRDVRAIGTVPADLLRAVVEALSADETTDRSPVGRLRAPGGTEWLARTLAAVQRDRADRARTARDTETRTAWLRERAEAVAACPWCDETGRVPGDPWPCDHVDPDERAAVTTRGADAVRAALATRTRTAS